MNHLFISLCLSKSLSAERKTFDKYLSDVYFFLTANLLVERLNVNFQLTTYTWTKNQNLVYQFGGETVDINKTDCKMVCMYFVKIS